MKKNQIRKFKNIYGSGTIRSGGSLICNLLSTHKDVIILIDILHFFRQIYKKYEPIYKKSNLYKLSGDLSIFLKYRKNINIDKKVFFKNLIKKKPKKYSDVYDSLLQTFSLLIPQKKIIAEYAGGEWRKIGKFLSFNKKNIAFQITRDPRGMMSSWKKTTFSRGYKYLNSIFNWIDSIDYALRYKKKYSSERFLLIKFEDIHQNPANSSNKLCNFLGIKMDKNMLITKKWKRLLNNNFTYVNVSAYNSKSVYGFSVRRINSWKNNLKDWEVALIEYLCESRMKKIGYKVYKKNLNLYKKGLNIMRQDSLLKKRLKIFLTKNKGTHEKLNDPSKPKNWAVTDNTKRKIRNISTKFINSQDYKNYLKELKIIKEESKLVTMNHF